MDKLTVSRANLEVSIEAVSEKLTLKLIRLDKLAVSLANLEVNIEAVSALFNLVITLPSSFSKACNKLSDALIEPVVETKPVSVFAMTAALVIVGLEAVPPNSPASFTIPLVVAVASVAPDTERADKEEST